MATTTKGNTKEASSKMKPNTEKGMSAKSMATKSAAKSTTKTTASKTAAPKAATSKTTASKTTGTRKTAANATAKARTAGKKASGSKSTTSDAKSNTATRDHDTIRAWVEKRGGVPSVVKGTAKKKDGDGILRIDFPGYSGEDSLQEISWDEFFRKFDESKLEFLYQEKTADGKESRFNKFVSNN